MSLCLGGLICLAQVLGARSAPKRHWQPATGSAGYQGQSPWLVGWDDLPPAIQRRLNAAGVDAVSFPAYTRDHERRTLERVRESDLDALIYFALQSTAFTREPPIEPALSAKAFVEGLDPEARQRFLSGAGSPSFPIPAPARRRLTSLADLLESQLKLAPTSGKPTTGKPAPTTAGTVPSGSSAWGPASAGSTASRPSRLQYIAEIARREAGEGRSIESVLLREYARAMRFLYQMELAARERADAAGAIAALYRGRGLSTDTAVEAGYLVHLGLATMKVVEPARRIRRVLIVGPGLDLAPRTGLVEAGAPESHQPYAVMDALLALGLARLEELTVTGADVNPRVVHHLQSATSRDVVLALVSGVADGGTVTLEDDYRRYFDGVGGAIGTAAPGPALPDRYRGRLRKSLRLRWDASQRVDAVTLDVTTQRLGGSPFDLVVATNVFPYLDDAPLALALANIVAMLAPGGVLLHNEPRALVADVTRELGVPLAHARTAVIATVRGSPAPLYDSVFVHVNGTR